MSPHTKKQLGRSKLKKKELKKCKFNNIAEFLGLVARHVQDGASDQRRRRCENHIDSTAGISDGLFIYESLKDSPPKDVPEVGTH